MTIQIILNGGPKDGEVMAIENSLYVSGCIKVHIGPSPAEMATQFDPDSMAVIPLKVGMYELNHYAAGRYGTCEYREWDEWHWRADV